MPASTWTDQNTVLRPHPLADRIRQLGRAKFARDVLVLQLSNTVQKAVAAGYWVFLIRLLTPEQYGQYIIVLTFFGTINLLGNLGLGPMLVTRLGEAAASDDRAEVRRVAGYLLKSSLVLAIMVMAVVWLVGQPLAAWWYQEVSYGDLTRILALGAPLVAISSVMTASLQSVRRMNELALVENGTRMIGAVLGIAAVLAGFGLSGLLSATVIGQALGCLLALLTYQLVLRRHHDFPSLSAMAATALTVPWRSYFRFSALALVDKNVAGLFAQSPVHFLGRFASPAEVAYYNVGLKVFSLLAAFHGAVARNLSAALAQEKGKVSLPAVRSLFWRVTLLWTPLACVLAGGLALSLPLFRWLLGADALPSTPLIVVLAVHSGLMALGIGFSSIFLVTDRIGLNIAIKTPINLAFLPVGALLVQQWGAIGAVLYLMAAYSAGYVAYLSLLASQWFWRTSAERAATSSGVVW